MGLQNSEKNQRVYSFFVYGMIVFTLILRLINLGKRPVMEDKGIWTIEGLIIFSVIKNNGLFSQKALFSIFGYHRQAYKRNHPPTVVFIYGFFLFLGQMFNISSGFALRFCSVLFLTGTQILIWRRFKKDSPRLGAISVIIFCLNPFFFDNSRDAHFYNWLVFFGVGFLFSIEKLFSALKNNSEKDLKKKSLFAGVWAGLSLSSNATAVILVFWVSIFVFAKFIRSNDFPKKARYQAILLYIGSGALLSGWYYLFLIINSLFWTGFYLHRTSIDELIGGRTSDYSIESMISRTWEYRLPELFPIWDDDTTQNHWFLQSVDVLGVNVTNSLIVLIAFIIILWSFWYKWKRNELEVYSVVVLWVIIFFTGIMSGWAHDIHPKYATLLAMLFWILLIEGVNELVKAAKKLESNKIRKVFDIKKKYPKIKLCKQSSLKLNARIIKVTVLILMVFISSVPWLIEDISIVQRNYENDPDYARIIEMREIIENHQPGLIIFKGEVFPSAIRYFFGATTAYMECDFFISTDNNLAYASADRYRPYLKPSRFPEYNNTGMSIYFLIHKVNSLNETVLIFSEFEENMYQNKWERFAYNGQHIEVLYLIVMEG